MLVSRSDSDFYKFDKINKSSREDQVSCALLRCYNNCIGGITPFTRDLYRYREPLEPAIFFCASLK